MPKGIFKRFTRCSVGFCDNLMVYRMKNTTTGRINKSVGYCRKHRAWAIGLFNKRGYHKWIAVKKEAQNARNRIFKAEKVSRS